MKDEENEIKRTSGKRISFVLFSTSRRDERIRSRSGDGGCGGGGAQRPLDDDE